MVHADNSGTGLVGMRTLVEMDSDRYSLLAGFDNASKNAAGAVPGALMAPHRQVAGSLICRLQRIPAPRPDYEYGCYAEVAVTNNTSAHSVDIAYTNHPVEVFDFIVTDEHGETIGNANFGGLYAAGASRQRFLSLKPGETYTHRVYLLAGIPENRRRPGKYLVRAVLHFGESRIESNPVVIGIPDANPAPSAIP
jgi:hypothetical protein